jgi:hypothetical protein
MAKSYTVQYDALGRPYFDMPGMKGPSYVSPAAMGQAPPPDTTGVFRHGPQWNQNTGKWETPIDWSNVLNVGVGSALGAGVLSAAGVFGGGAGAASSSSAGAGAGAGGGAAGGAGAGTGAGVSAGVAAGAGAKMGIPTLVELGLKYGLPALGNVIDTKMTTGANADAARIQQEYYNKALAAALEEQAYERKRLEEQTAYDRLHSEDQTAYTRQHAAELLGINQGAFGNYLSQLAPYRTAGTTALERMQAALGGSPWQPNNGVTRTFL